MKAISVATALILASAIPGFCQAQRHSLASIFNSKLAFYLPAPDSTPISTSVVNAAGGGATISPDTWLEIHGSNLSTVTGVWDNFGFDFSNGALPTSLGGVSATVNGKSAPVYYISPVQVNILAPLDFGTTGPVPVKLTTQFGSTTFTANEQAISPGFLVDGGGPYVAALHLDFSLVGPASMSVPGYTFTPMKPGDTVVLYATGFGVTSPPLTTLGAGAGTQLPTKPTVTIGNIPATVSFAGISGPGLYQLNVVVPANAPDGDLALVASYNGQTTQNGVLLTVKK